MANHSGHLAAGRGPPPSSIAPRTPIEGGEGDQRGSAGGKSPDCVESRRAASASALFPTVDDFSSPFWDVLRLLQSGLVRTFLSEGECKDVAGGVMPHSGTGVSLSAEATREVLGRLRGGGRPHQGEAAGGKDEW